LFCESNQELINLFLAGASQVQKACLDCLLAVMLDSSTNQKVWFPFFLACVLDWNSVSGYPLTAYFHLTL
jgi:hypothetical protein